jgi:Lar family restriction alleviation protein
MEDLKRCPFCGSKIDNIDYTSERGDTYSKGWEVYQITCPGCAAYMSNDKRDDLIAAWNKRA